MWQPLFFVLGAIVAVHSQTTAVSRCSLYAGEPPLNVYVHGCDTPPCQLPQLQTAIVDVIFKAPHRLDNLRTLAAAFLSIFPINYNLGDDSVTCNNLVNSYCPILEGEVIHYRLLMYIESFMAVGIQVPIEFRVLEEDNSPVFCFRTTIRIVSGQRSNNTTLTMDHS